MAIIEKLRTFVLGEDPDDGYGVGETVEEPEEEYASSETESTSRFSKAKYVNINANSNLSVVLVKPESFAEATGIADHLNQKRTVVLNLESADKAVSRRLVDFLSGAAYANNGTLKRVANCTFIITPNNVDIMGDELLEDFESGGMYI